MMISPEGVDPVIATGDASITACISSLVSSSLSRASLRSVTSSITVSRYFGLSSSSRMMSRCAVM